MTKKTTTKKAFAKKLLSKEATNLIYRKIINSVAYHLANETSNAPTDTVLRKKMYFDLQRKVRALIVSYDSEKKRATQIMDGSKLDTLLKAKSIPTTLLGKAKTTAKPKAKAKRI